VVIKVFLLNLILLIAQTCRISRLFSSFQLEAAVSSADSKIKQAMDFKLKMLNKNSIQIQKIKQTQVVQRFQRLK